MNRLKKIQAKKKVIADADKAKSDALIAAGDAQGLACRDSVQAKSMQASRPACLE